MRDDELHMTKTKYTFRNITLLNIILMTAVFFMGKDMVVPLQNATVTYSMPAQKIPPADLEEATAEYNPPSSSDYLIISEENVFHPERRIPPEKKAEQELPKPEFILYGTLLSDDINTAYLEDLKAPRNTPGRGKRQVALKKGDTLSGFTLREIEQDKIVMVRGEDRMIILLVDPQKPKTRDVVATTSKTTPGQPPQIPQKASSKPSPKPPVTPAPGSLVKPEPLTKTRAPMTPADERTRGFFQR